MTVTRAPQDQTDEVPPRIPLAPAPPGREVRTSGSGRGAGSGHGDVPRMALLVVAVLSAVGLARWAARRVRAWQLTWGASAEESTASLPGDGFVPAADLVATRAISIPAPAAQIWPWIAQLGQERGGFYSYDRLENLVGCRIRSADEVVAAWQDVRVGDALHLHPDIALEVARVDPGHALVLRGAVPTPATTARGATGEASDRSAVPAAAAGAPPYDFSWAFVLQEQPGGTRLVVRERYGYVTPRAAALVEPLAVVSFVMTQRMLRGIRDRATTSTKAR